MFKHLLTLYRYETISQDNCVLVKLVPDNKKIGGAIWSAIAIALSIFTLFVILPKIMVSHIEGDVLLVGMLSIISIAIISGFILKILITMVFAHIISLEDVLVLDIEKRIVSIPEQEVEIPFEEIKDVDVSPGHIFASHVDTATLILKKGKKRDILVPFPTKEDGNEFIAFMRNIIGKTTLSNATLLF